MAVRDLWYRRPRLSWPQKSLLAGGLIGAAWMLWPRPSLDSRVLSDTLLYILLPGALALTHGRHLGWRIDRTAIRNAALLAVFVLPFYLVGSALPSIRAYYPMWETSAALPVFLPHAAKQLIVVIAAETYFRGLLCVGVRELGFASVFISPLLYALQHTSKPPVELLLSGPTDVLFGAVDYRSTSILPSVIAHGFGLVLLDWLVLHPPLFDPQRVAQWLSWLPLSL